jgi:hypothetical protein
MKIEPETTEEPGIPPIPASWLAIGKPGDGETFACPLSHEDEQP